MPGRTVAGRLVVSCLVAALASGCATPPSTTGASIESQPDENLQERTVDETAGSTAPTAPARGSVPGAGTDWERAVPGGGCVCADGSEFAFWVREADPTRVVFHLEGGGVCFDAETCALTGEGENDHYDWNLSTETPGLGGGVFDFDRADNPFADHTIVWVSSCTGDAYLGDVARSYGPDLTVEHRGWLNATTALELTAQRFPDSEQVVVLGKTAGGIAAPVYGALAADLLPAASVTVLAAQAGAYPDGAETLAELVATWGAFDTMPDWDVNQGLSAEEWAGSGLWIQAGRHRPDVVMARFDYAFDANAARWAEQLGGIDPTDLVDLLDANEATIEAAGVPVHSYTAPGNSHGILEYDSFYDLAVEGVPLVDWTRSLLDGEPPADVRCGECGTP